MNISQMKNFPFECKGIKTHKGHEGEPLRQASLYYQGKKIGFVGEGDWGGPATLDVIPEYRQVVQDFIKAQGTVTITLPPGPGRQESFQHQYNEDSFVDDALTFSETSKKIETLRKKNTICFVLPDDEPDTYRTVKGCSHPAEKVIEHIKSKYPDAQILQPAGANTK